MPLKKIALTGNIGSGKTTVAKIFEMMGTRVYYADAEAHKFFETAEVKQKVKELFSTDVFFENKIDRKALAAVVFNSKEALGLLNGIIHPLVLQDFAAYCKNLKTTKKYVIMESAIIFESNLSHLFDKVILVSAPKNIRIERVAMRDKTSKSKILERLKNQLPEKELLKLTPYHIINDNKKSLIQQTEKLDTFLNL